MAGEADQAHGQPGSEKWVTWRDTIIERTTSGPRVREDGARPVGSRTARCRRAGCGDAARRAAPAAAGAGRTAGAGLLAKARKSRPSSRVVAASQHRCAVVAARRGQPDVGVGREVRRGSVPRTDAFGRAARPSRGGGRSPAPARAPGVAPRCRAPRCRGRPGTCRRPSSCARVPTPRRGDRDRPGAAGSACRRGTRARHCSVRVPRRCQRGVPKRMQHVDRLVASRPARRRRRRSVPGRAASPANAGRSRRPAGRRSASPNRSSNRLAPSPIVTVIDPCVHQRLGLDGPLAQDFRGSRCRTPRSTRAAGAASRSRPDAARTPSALACPADTSAPAPAHPRELLAATPLQPKGDCPLLAFAGLAGPSDPAPKLLPPLTYEIDAPPRPAAGRSLPSWPTARPLRAWQQAAAAAVFDHDGDAFLRSATPAAGKTTFGLHVAHRMLVRGARGAGRRRRADDAHLPPVGAGRRPLRHPAGAQPAQQRRARAARPPRGRRHLRDRRRRRRRCTGAAAPSARRC